MVAQVEATNSVQAWAKGVLAIRANGAPLSPLVTVVEHPCEVGQNWWHAYSPNRVSPEANTLHGVVEMLGPTELLRGEIDRQVIYQQIWRKFDRARRRHRHLSNWRETYFERLTRGPNNQNRLEEIIHKMNSWTTKRIASFYVHTSSNSQDAIVPIGSPCLQYVQFLQRPDDKLDMLALYRNHDFFRKVLGNYIGLGRVLQFVARETDQEPGRLTCVSVNAYLDQQRRVCRLAELALQN